MTVSGGAKTRASQHAGHSEPCEDIALKNYSTIALVVMNRNNQLDEKVKAEIKSILVHREHLRTKKQAKLDRQRKAKERKFR
jgi:hypothetical protein